MTHAGPALRLRPMRPDELPAFLEHSIVSYAHGIETQGGQTAEFARKKSEEDHAAILPDGPRDARPHPLDRRGRRRGGSAVLWLAERDRAAGA